MKVGAVSDAQHSFANAFFQKLHEDLLCNSRFLRALKDAFVVIVVESEIDVAVATDLPEHLLLLFLCALVDGERVSAPRPVLYLLTLVQLRVGFRLELLLSHRRILRGVMLGPHFDGGSPIGHFQSLLVYRCLLF